MWVNLPTTVFLFAVLGVCCLFFYDRAGSVCSFTAFGCCLFSMNSLMLLLLCSALGASHKPPHPATRSSTSSSNSNGSTIVSLLLSHLDPDHVAHP